MRIYTILTNVFILFLLFVTFEIFAFQGFTTAPGDCLAFMFHRLASEAKVKASRDKALEQGFSVVVSDSARKRLAELSSN